MSETKPCGLNGCTNMCVRRDNESRANFRDRLFCSKKCSAKAREMHVHVTVKTCPVCEREFTRRQGEGSTAWRERIYCSHPCRDEGVKAKLNEAQKERAAPPTPYQIAVNAACTINAYWRQYNRDAGAYVTTCDGAYVVRSKMVNGVPL